MVEDFPSNLTRVLEVLSKLYHNCTIILGTMCDPTDGVGDLGIPDGDIQWAYDLFHAFNGAILDLGKSYGAQIANIYSHFLGHGSQSPNREGFNLR